MVVGVVVGDTISEIMGRMSSLPAFGHNNTTIAEKIKHHLLKIKGVVAAKLEQNDTTRDRDWLGQVADVVTDLFDLVDDLDLPLPADAAQSTPSMIRSIFSVFNLTPHSPLLKQIEKRLGDLAASADAIMLSLMNVELLTNSDAEDQEIEIVGREDDKEAIIEQIFAEENVEGAVPAVAIQGIQGIGKTKLAKFIFDDERVKSDFDLMIWIDGIHEKFYAELVVNRMIESAMMKNDSVVMDENVNLGEALRGSRFFLVLDDLRNENREEWLRLHHMLTEAATPTGGAVLITTQSGIVAQMVDSYLSDLEELDEEESWSLFEQIAGGPSDAKIIDAQKRMVKKCGGVPVAVLTMARLVRSREAITESEINQLEEEFMQEMQLRYYNELPSWHLKQCFAYSSFIFSAAPKAKAETLIRLWMAEGFLGPISSSSPREPEDFGLECIQEFHRRSIFRTHENKKGILESCSMSDKLMEDLSAFVARHDSLSTYNPAKDFKERVRRVSLNSDLDVSNGIPKSFKRINKRLCTILFMASKYSRVPYEVKLSSSACDAIFCGFKRLRVLILQDLGMNMLPSSIGKVKSLRYLDLSHNNMKKLPNSIGELKHLQTLILSHCHELRELPNDVNHFASLRHMEMDECLHLTHMPSALKNLAWLRTLSHFVTSTNKNHNHTGGLGELVNLNNLRGELEISHLERLKFKDPDKDGDAYLKQKQHLLCLTLRWNQEDEDEEDNNEHHDDQISLKHLEPHSNIQILSIVGYEGNKFSDWLLSLINLVEFSLYNCSKCEYLPPLDQLPKLKILQLKRLDSLKFITNQDAATEPFFPSLEELTISNCPNLTSWWKERTYNNVIPSLFPSISKLQVQYCPKLNCMPLFPHLDDSLVLKCSSLKPLQKTINYTTSTSTSRRTSNSHSDCSPSLSKLKKLTIANVEEQSPLPEEWLKNFISLKNLNIREWLKSLPEGIKHLTSLNVLKIESCPELTSLTDGIRHLESLTSLGIYECHKLASLPQGMTNLKSLKSLKIRNCPLLLPRCQNETGDDWPHIKHIKDITVKHTSQYYD